MVSDTECGLVVSLETAGNNKISMSVTQSVTVFISAGKKQEFRQGQSE